jgi:hypothetical protein
VEWHNGTKRKKTHLWSSNYDPGTGEDNFFIA